MYEINNDGTIIRNIKSKKIRSQRMHKNGRMRVSIRFGDELKEFYTHRLVYDAWGPEPLDPDKHIHHINEVKLDNRISNLQQITPEEHSKLHAEPEKMKNISDRMSKQDRIELGYKNSKYLEGQAGRFARENPEEFKKIAKMNASKRDQDKLKISGKKLKEYPAFITALKNRYVGIYTIHEDKEIYFENLFQAADWICNMYPEYTQNRTTVRNNIRKAKKGVVYKHQWYYESKNLN